MTLRSRGCCKLARSCYAVRGFAADFTRSESYAHTLPVRTVSPNLTAESFLPASKGLTTASSLQQGLSAATSQDSVFLVYCRDTKRQISKLFQISAFH